MKISHDEVLHVAQLARINITDEEISDFAKQLGDILSYMDTLSKIDTMDIPPTFHVVPAKNVMRDDIPGKSLSNEEATANAPKADNGAFVVPRII